MIGDVELGGLNGECSASPAVWFDSIDLVKIVSQSITHVCGFSTFLLVAVGLAQPERARAARDLLTGILGLPAMVASRCVDID